MEIKNLELTERDFQLLVEALDHLPEKGSTGELMSEMIVGMLAGDRKDTPEFKEYERKSEIKRRSAQNQRDQLKEDIRILQGKLILFKRFLIQQNALKQVDDILNPQP